MQPYAMTARLLAIATWRKLLIERMQNVARTRLAGLSGTMQLVVRDPWGLDHRLEHDGDRWWGSENLAHGAAAGRHRVIIEDVVRAIATGSALPAGYRKVVRISGQPGRAELLV